MLPEPEHLSMYSVHTVLTNVKNIYFLAQMTRPQQSHTPWVSRGIYLPNIQDLGQKLTAA
jgi:hypothetical protein